MSCMDSSSSLKNLTISTKNHSKTFWKGFVTRDEFLQDSLENKVNIFF